jgi:prevent-host-death family protein
MPRTVSSSEAQNNFGAMVQWAKDNVEGVIVERRGKPEAALISYEEYQAMLQLKEDERKRKAFEALEKLRQEVQRLNPDISAEEAYREAGFSEEAIQSTLKSRLT